MPVNDLIALIQSSVATFLDEKLKNMATKTHMESISTDIGCLQQNNKALQLQLDQMPSRCMSLERRVELLEKKSNEQNIILHIPKQNGLDAVQRAKSVCLELNR